jgi:hypothetical protein
MTHEAPESRKQVLFLSAYRELSQKLVELIQVEDELDIERLTFYMNERDRLIASYVPDPAEHSSDADVQTLLAEIRRLDAIVMSGLAATRSQVQQKMQGLQQQKRGVNAYNSDFAYGSAFVDRRE